MANELTAFLPDQAGATLRVLLFKSDYSQVWSVSGTAWATYSGGSIANYKITATEGERPGTFKASMPAVTAGSYIYEYINSSNVQLALGSIDWDGTAEVSANTYYADVNFTRNSNTSDKYTVQWFRNGSPVSVTSPTIQVVDRTGSDLVASTSMTAIGSTGVVKYDTSDDTQSRGTPAIVIVTATIDGATRTWRRVLGRDLS